MAFKTKLIGGIIACIVFAILIFAFIFSQNTDDSAKVRNLPDLARRHGKLTSITLSGQQQVTYLNDTESSGKFQDAIMSSEIGNNSSDNQFITYRTRLVFEDGYTIDFETFTTRSREIIFINDDEVHLAMRTLKFAGRLPERLGNALDRLARPPRDSLSTKPN